jgi:ketosteroid isomerase-like protein
MFATWEGQNVAAVLRGLPRTFEELPDELRTWIEQTYDPDVEVSFTAEGPDWQIHLGYAGLIRAYAEWMQEWDEYYYEPKEFIEVGDEVFVPHINRGRSRSGVELEEEITNVFTVRHGRIVRIRAYATKEEALQAVALPK